MMLVFKCNLECPGNCSLETDTGQRQNLVLPLEALPTLALVWVLQEASGERVEWGSSGKTQIFENLDQAGTF